jgi:hypothetical protein
MRHLTESIKGNWKPTLSQPINPKGLYLFWRAKIDTDNGIEWESGYAKDYIVVNGWTQKYLPSITLLKTKLTNEFQKNHYTEINNLVIQSHPNFNNIDIQFIPVFGYEIHNNKGYEVTYNKCFGTKKGAVNLIGFDWSGYKKLEAKGFEDEAEDAERKREEKYQREMEEKTKNERERKEMEERRELEKSYTDAGCMNGWSDTYPDEKTKELVRKAQNGNAYFVRSLGRGYNEYVSDKYKVIWRVDSTD